MLTDLPPLLGQALQKLMGSKAIQPQSFKNACLQLSQGYRDQEIHGLGDDELRLAYLAIRLPGTFSALSKILKEVPSTPESLLELGSGVGVAVWGDVPSLNRATLVEQNGGLIKLGQILTKDLDVQIDWRQENLTKSPSYAPHDLVVLSYVLGELKESDVIPLVEKAWDATVQTLVIVEPGTPKGFQRLRDIRTHLLGKGAYIIAPCTHKDQCPMTGKDWCHFMVRHNRAPTHWALKEGGVDFSDEKYSFIIFGKIPKDTVGQRILKAPILGSGHVILDLCAPEKMERVIVSKKTKETYKKAKKIHWGDIWE